MRRWRNELELAKRSASQIGKISWHALNGVRCATLNGADVTQFTVSDRIDTMATDAHGY